MQVSTVTWAEGGSAPDPATVSTALLSMVRSGDREALERLFALVYDELRRMADGQLRREPVGHTLQPTALVHEVFLRFVDAEVPAADRSHFIGIAARAMRQVLVDHARRRVAAKRGGGRVRTTLGGGELALELDPVEMLDLDRALASLDDRQRRVVELRFFAGLEEREIGEVLGVTERTVRRDWVKARAWLYAALYPEEPAAPSGLTGPGAEAVE